MTMRAGETPSLELVDNCPGTNHVSHENLHIRIIHNLKKDEPKVATFHALEIGTSLGCGDRLVGIDAIDHLLGTSRSQGLADNPHSIETEFVATDLVNPFHIGVSL